MIRETEVFRIGRITRTRGVCGEVEMQFTDDVFDRGTADYFVLRTDGILVPFFWEEYRFKNHSTLILKLEDYDHEDRAKRLVGCDVYYPTACLPDEDEADMELSSYRALTGFRVTDEQGARLGEIAAVDDRTANVLLTLVRPDGTTALLPYHDDFLLGYDIRRRELQLQLPPGLLDLNP